MSKMFTRADTWNGGFYELDIEFGSHSDEQMNNALKALWEHKTLEGCYLNKYVEPPLQQRISPDIINNPAHKYLYGVATLPNGKRAASGTIAMSSVQGADWLLFYIPIGALCSVYKLGAYPFDTASESRTWEESVDEWLADIGKHVFSAIAFRFAVIGMEGITTRYARELLVSGVPKERPIGYLWPKKGELVWYPVNV